MYVGNLITKIRQRTGKTRYSVDSSGNPTEGIPQTLVLDFINEAKDFIQAAIVSAGSTICDVQLEIDITANEEEYTIADNVHFGNKIKNVQYSFDGNARNYRDLPQLRDEERSSRTDSSLTGYIRRGKKLILVPIPSRAGGKIRPEYPRQWDDLGLIVGQVTSSTSTQIVLDNDSYLDAVQLSLLTGTSKICTVDSDGEVQDYNLSVVSYNSGTRTITITSTTLAVSAGGFVVVGAYATTHTDFLPTPLVQQYIKVEAQMRMFDTTTSVDAIRENSFLKKIYEAIIEGYEDELLDEVDIPISDPYAMS